MKIFLICGLSALAVSAATGAAAPPSCEVNPREGKCYKGSPIVKPSKVSSWQKCCSACSSQKGCTAYSYDPTIDLCSLFDGKATPATKSGNCFTQSCDGPPALGKVCVCFAISVAGPLFAPTTAPVIFSNTPAPPSPPPDCRSSRTATESMLTRRTRGKALSIHS